ncbi:MAG: hypothetical protein FJ012_08630 [Chloroflexi bacterium]|nr:hypothetical protein [Chloroflexota bacterium]
MAYLKLLLDQSMRPNGYPGEGIIERHARSGGQTIDVLDFSQNGQPGQDPVDPVEYLYVRDGNGWNQIVWKSGNTSVAEAIEPIVSQVVSIWSFDNVTKTWKAYSPSAPSWANDLKSMDTTQAFWIEVRSDVVWYY